MLPLGGFLRAAPLRPAAPSGHRGGDRAGAAAAGPTHPRRPAGTTTKMNAPGTELSDASRPAERGPSPACRSVEWLDLLRQPAARSRNPWLVRRAGGPGALRIRRPDRAGHLGAPPCSPPCRRSPFFCPARGQTQPRGWPKRSAAPWLGHPTATHVADGAGTPRARGRAGAGPASARDGMPCWSKTRTASHGTAPPPLIAEVRSDVGAGDSLAGRLPFRRSGRGSGPPRAAEPPHWRTARPAVQLPGSVMPTPDLDPGGRSPRDTPTCRSTTACVTGDRAPPRRTPSKHPTVVRTETLHERPRQTDHPRPGRAGRRPRSREVRRCAALADRVAAERPRHRRRRALRRRVEARGAGAHRAARRPRHPARGRPR